MSRLKHSISKKSIIAIMTISMLTSILTTQSMACDSQCQAAQHLEWNRCHNKGGHWTGFSCDYNRSDSEDSSASIGDLFIVGIFAATIGAAIYQYNKSEPQIESKSK